MGRFHTNLKKGDLILLSHKDKDKFDGVVGMVAKRDLFQESGTCGSGVGRPQGNGDCIVFDMDDFEPLGDFYNITGQATSYRETIAVDDTYLVVPNGCNWVIKGLHVGWDPF